MTTTNPRNTSSKRTGLAKVHEAAAYLSCSRSTIRRMLDSGRLPHKLVGSHRRIPWTALYEFAGEDN